MVLLSFPQHKRSKCRDRNGRFVKFYSALLKRLLNCSGSPYSDLKEKNDRLTLLFTLLSMHSIDIFYPAALHFLSTFPWCGLSSSL